MNNKWLLRDYEDGDEERINPLLNLVYKINRDLSYWNWEFRGNPIGFKTVLAVDGPRIIGHIAAINREMKLHDSEILASLEVEGVTHPEYQRQGIFVAMGQKLISDMKKEGISYVYGFPNENALPGHRKLNCIELFNLHIMIRPINMKNISKKRVANNLLGLLANIAGRLTFKLFYRPKKPQAEIGVKIKTISEFDSRFDDFWEKVKKDHNILLKRDSKYLNWRYTKCPEKEYKIYAAEKDNEILAWVVVRVLKRFDLDNGAIVDLLGLHNHENVMHALIMKVVEDLKQKKVDLVACSIPKTSSYYNLLRKCGFATCPKKLNPKEEPMILYPLTNDTTLDYIKNPSNWYITWGDTDVV
jgi:GNAT superfamily N-acetyltransferase